MDESALLHLIGVLGDTLARLQAIHAREEYALQQIVASIKFVNHTVDAWAGSSQQQAPESAEVHVYESDFSEVSKSIDAILDEARTARGTCKPSAIPKRPQSTPRDAETSKAAVHKKKLERFSQALRIRPRKTVSSIEDAEHSSFSAAQEMLLKWMGNKKDGWINRHAERQDLNSTRQSSPRSERKTLEKSNAEKKFLDCLWRIHSTSPDIGHGNDDSNTTGTESEVPTMTQRMRTNVEVLQAHRKLLNERHLNEIKLLRVGEGFAFEEEKHRQQRFSNHEESSVANHDCWLSEEICWKVLEPHAKGIVWKHEARAIPTFYSDLQQTLTMMQLMHSIHSNIFHSHLQSLLSQSFLKPSAQLGRRVEDVLSNPSVYICFRLAHCLVCHNGKALLSIARRVTIS